MTLWLILVLILDDTYQTVPGETCFHKATNSRGVCRPLINCTYAYKGVLNQVEPQVCRLGETAPIVCCPINTTSTTVRKTRSVPRSISSKKCLEYSRRVNVGTSTVGCSNVPTGEFPHMAAILYDSEQPSYNCFGTLISENFVLTPAHCHFSPWQNATEVHLGLTNLTSSDDPKVQKFKIKNVTIHPNNEKEMYYDLALIELDGEVRFNQYVHPICLDDDGGWEDGKFVMAGWTYDSGDLKEVAVDVVNSSQCTLLHSSKQNVNGGLSKGILDDRQICVKIKGGLTLQFGSPLQIRKNKVDCMYTLVGFLTFADPQNSQLPAILTKVKPYKEWIESVVWLTEKSSKIEATDVTTTKKV